MNFQEYLKELCKENASDIHFKVGSPPLIRISGVLQKVNSPPLAPKETEIVAKEVLTEKDFIKLEGPAEIDTSYTIPGFSRFRVNA